MLNKTAKVFFDGQLYEEALQHLTKATDVTFIIHIKPTEANVDHKWFIRRTKAGPFDCQAIGVDISVQGGVGMAYAQFHIVQLLSIASSFIGALSCSQL